MTAIRQRARAREIFSQAFEFGLRFSSADRLCLKNRQRHPSKAPAD
jgi:hypothetical protein